MARRALRAELNPTLRNPNTRSKQDALKPNGGYHVRILTIALTTMAVVLLAGWAEATTLAGTESLPSSPRNFSTNREGWLRGTRPLPGRATLGLRAIWRMRVRLLRQLCSSLCCSPSLRRSPSLLSLSVLTIETVVGRMRETQRDRFTRWYGVLAEFSSPL